VKTEDDFFVAITGTGIIMYWYGTGLPRLWTDFGKNIVGIVH